MRRFIFDSAILSSAPKDWKRVNFSTSLSPTTSLIPFLHFDIISLRNSAARGSRIPPRQPIASLRISAFGCALAISIRMGTASAAGPLPIAFVTSPLTLRSVVERMRQQPDDPRIRRTGAAISIGDQNSDRLRSVKLTTKSEQDGKYSIQDIPYGEYSFRVTSKDYEPYQITLYIGSDMLTQIHVRLKRKK